MMNRLGFEPYEILLWVFSDYCIAAEVFLSVRVLVLI